MLKAKNVERWDGLRLWVYRVGNGEMPCALIMRYSRGGNQDDVLLGRSRIPAPSRPAALADPYAALLLAILELRGSAFVHNLLLDFLARECAPSPVGDHGGTEPLDIPGNVKDEAPPPYGQSAPQALRSEQ